MKDRVVEILVYIMAEMQENKQLHDIDLLHLRDRGYTTSEISAAFSWLYENMPADGVESVRPGSAARGSRRMLHDAEKAVLSTGAQGYLIQLGELGILDDRDIETLIERAMTSGYIGLTVQEVRELAAVVLFSRDRRAGSTGHSILNNEDTIH